MEIRTINVFGFEGAQHGMRNPLNSWAKADSEYHWGNGYVIGPNDMNLAKRLISAGPEHCKFLRMIHVQADITAPRWWWSEFDTYHFNTKNSTSTMHKLLNNPEPISINQFETDGMDDEVFVTTLNRLESLRQAYRATTDSEKQRRLLRRAKNLLPEGFLQMRTVDTNYAEQRTIYHQRKNHRMKEAWVDCFCAWVESLPYADEFLIN